ncbi:MAG: dTMP kinase [bacterium]
MKGKFITLEGSEGCGKTTQIELLATWLKEKNKPVVCLREPGGTPLGETVRRLLKHDPAGHGMCAEAELLLFAASRAELVRRVIQPSLEKGEWVLCDRFLDSTTVYQGIARGLDAKTVAAINHFAVASCLPDLTLVLELEAEEARRRLLRRPRPAGLAPDRMESEPELFFQKVREGYQKLAKQEPQRVRLIPARGSRQEIADLIQKELRHAFPRLLD